MIEVLAYYRFVALDEARQRDIGARIEDLGERFGLRGLILLGAEGINLTAAGSAASVAALERVLRECVDAAPADFKRARADRPPFRVLRVKLRSEIVTMGRPDLRPPAGKNNHLTPAEWDRALREPDVVVLDTRNDYEVELGKFRGAHDLNLSEFREFPDRMRASDLPKTQKLLIYCTGGIRCEKAILELRDQGYENVRQLDGGILNYLEEFPNEQFEGECFVFDYRVAVDQNLAPTTKFGLCPHCGQPANREVTCAQCEAPATVCARCASAGPTCSKNCAHHLAIGSKSRRPHAPEAAKRRRAGPT